MYGGALQFQLIDCWFAQLILIDWKKYQLKLIDWVDQFNCNQFLTTPEVNPEVGLDKISEEFQKSKNAKFEKLSELCYDREKF